MHMPAANSKASADRKYVQSFVTWCSAAPNTEYLVVLHHPRTAAYHYGRCSSELIFGFSLLSPYPPTASVPSCIIGNNTLCLPLSSDDRETQSCTIGTSLIPNRAIASDFYPYCTRDSALSTPLVGGTLDVVCPRPCQAHVRLVGPKCQSSPLALSSSTHDNGNDLCLLLLALNAVIGNVIGIFLFHLICHAKEIICYEEIKRKRHAPR